MDVIDHHVLFKCFGISYKDLAVSGRCPQSFYNEVGDGTSYLIAVNIRLTSFEVTPILLVVNTTSHNFPLRNKKECTVHGSLYSKCTAPMRG